MYITEELKKSKEYMLKTFSFNGEELVELTPDNVARVMAMIQNDSAYMKAFDKSAGPERYSRKETSEFKYGGSTAYWTAQLKKVLDSNPQAPADYSFEDTIKYLVAAIDRENKTHLNADGCGRAEICKRIIKKKDSLIELLKNQNKEYEIIHHISEKTCNGKGRENISFASKFAHYTAFYLFEGEEYQDGFSIYDGILIGALPKYLKAYNVKKKGYKGNYENYQDAIDSLLTAAEERHNKRISRNGFDQLVWYYHKGR